MMRSAPHQAVPSLRLTANLFGLPFGLCGLAQCWSAGNTLFGLQAWPAVTFWVLAGLAWLITLVAYCAKPPTSPI